MFKKMQNLLCFVIRRRSLCHSGPPPSPVGAAGGVRCCIMINQLLHHE
jgi:hypothetical protein